MTYSPSITNTPTDNTPRVTFGTDSQGENLSRVQPRDSQPGSTESGGEYESEGRGRSTELGCFVWVIDVIDSCARQTARKEHGDAHDHRAPVEGDSATKTIESEDAD